MSGRQEERRGEWLRRTRGKGLPGHPGVLHRAVGVLWEQIPENAAPKIDFSSLGVPQPDEAEGNIHVVKLEVNGVLHTEMPRRKGMTRCVHLKLSATGIFGGQVVPMKVLIDSGSDECLVKRGLLRGEVLRTRARPARLVMANAQYLPGGRRKHGGAEF